jgi:hypothetical protein
MNYFLLAASIAVSIAALLDGISTVRFLHDPRYEEGNAIFGRRPSAARVYGEGSAVIAIELIVAWWLQHLWWPMGYGIGAGFLYQAYIHVRNARANHKLPVTP